ncbi:MAG: hypothetical protein RL885_19660 [Planctomycetota bacterium]
MHSILATLLLLAAAPSDVTRFESKEYGFRFVSPEDWTGVPLRGERYVVGRFNGPDFRDPKTRMGVSGSAEVLVFEKAISGPSTGGSDEKSEQKSASAASWETALKARLGEETEEKHRRAVKVDGENGEQIWYEHGPEGMLTSWCLVVERERYDVVVRYTLPTYRIEKRDDRAIAAIVLKTFEWFEPEGAADVDLSQLSPRERTLHLAKSNLPDGYFLHETDRYVVISNTSKKITAEVAFQLEKIRDLYEKIFPLEEPIEAVSKVRIFANRDDYHAYGGPPSSAGFWSPGHEELVMFDNTAQDKNDTFAVLRHEAFHQYIYYRCGELSPHSWFNEGYGDYFSGAKYRGGSFGPGKFLWRTPVIRKALQEDTVIPMKDILAYTQRQYYEPKVASICYAQGWSIVYFLREGRLKHKEWDDILDKYLTKLVETRDRDQALAHAFEGVDIDEFEAEWKRFAGKL